ncbi:type I-E CRISPR-associated protein Cas7/Cse4/CasC [Kitasatospora sp. NPDC088783]|uniref:type I-E CRISPR-associated protein Cas7/Cse4/CasC n=1 Tax=Kitasatospora sp. NPDC088783 TaxID=3364077 RepID=UPI003809A455
MAVHICAHVVHDYPLSNLNRDDLGSPKTVEFGGALRGRTSSQNTKRVARVRVEERIGERALRTRRLPSQVAQLLRERGWDEEEAVAAGQAVVMASGIQGLIIGEGGMTSVMLYVPQQVAQELADLVVADRGAVLKVAAHAEAVAKAAADKTKKTKAPALSKEEKAFVKELQGRVREILSSRNASIAAFGRMLANSSESTVDGAVSVAHTLTTHALVEQPDFFTAVDDIPGEDAGSAHMGSAGHTSGTYYRYGSVNVSELVGNMGGDREAAEEFLRAFLRELAVLVPTAKQRNTAPFTPPALVYLTVRTDQPVNLSGAFEAPVTAKAGSGWTAPSIERLDVHAKAVADFFDKEALAEHGHAGTADLSGVQNLGKRIGSLGDLVELATRRALELELESAR